VRKQLVTTPSCQGDLEQAWHVLPVQDVAALLETDARTGLTEAESRERLAQYGPNRLTEEKHEPFWKEFLEELREPMVLLLLVTGVLYAIWGELSDAVTIFLVILTLNTIEVVNEQRAKKAISALRKLAEPTSAVLRAGQTMEMPAEQIVLGDAILLQAGRRVPADARLFEAYGLAVDESSLTGESVPVEKDASSTLETATPLAERFNMVYTGTLVTRGRGSAVVVGTGMSTELGRIAGLARRVKEPRTPLQQAMGELSRWMVWLALGFSVLVPVLGVLIARQPLETMLLTGLSLAFATIPEEMPIIITMVLALGAYRLSKQHAIVKRLKAVETLGAVTVIATDKTGTLTENRMEVQALYPDPNRQEALTIGVLCNDAALDGGDFAGDPLETALLREGQRCGLDVTALRAAYPLCDELTFDNSRKRMSAVRQRDGARWIAVKGAPESILEVSSRRWTPDGDVPLSPEDREAILETVAQMAARGLRVIAFAERVASTDRLPQAEIESDLAFVGLAGLADPPRLEVKAAIAECQRAGIRTVMITGDHPQTASAIGRQAGLNGDGRVMTGLELDALDEAALRDMVEHVSIYARTTPEHKLRIVTALKQRGERVAVTGDGTNDAPALVAADIGVAMGASGSDVAREAGDMVLADDNFTTITNAVREGRALFENLKKGVRYYLACKVALVSITLLPVLLQVPVPFAPIQIILMELFMDLAAAATFVAEPAEEDLMRRPPRDRAMVSSILTAAAGLFVAVSVVYLLAWYRGAGQAVAQTVAFAAWLLGHVLLAFNLRSERQPLVQVGFFSNRLMIVWGVAAVAFVLLATLVPPLQAVLKTASLSGAQWVLITGATLAGTFWLEIRKLIAFSRVFRA
jgi:Ca2+-transporting ATPase